MKCLAGLTLLVVLVAVHGLPTHDLFGIGSRDKTKARNTGLGLDLNEKGLVIQEHDSTEDKSRTYNEQNKAGRFSERGKTSNGQFNSEGDFRSRSTEEEQKGERQETSRTLTLGLQGLTANQETNRQGYENLRKSNYEHKHTSNGEAGQTGTGEFRRNEEMTDDKGSIQENRQSYEHRQSSSTGIGLEGIMNDQSESESKRSSQSRQDFSQHSREQNEFKREGGMTRNYESKEMATDTSSSYEEANSQSSYNKKSNDSPGLEFGQAHDLFVIGSRDKTKARNTGLGLDLNEKGLVIQEHDSTEDKSRTYNEQNKAGRFSERVELLNGGTQGGAGQYQFEKIISDAGTPMAIHGTPNGPAAFQVLSPGSFESYGTGSELRNFRGVSGNPVRYNSPRTGIPGSDINGVVNAINSKRAVSLAHKPGTYISEIGNQDNNFGSHVNVLHDYDGALYLTGNGNQDTIREEYLENVDTVAKTRGINDVFTSAYKRGGTEDQGPNTEYVNTLLPVIAVPSYSSATANEATNREDSYINGDNNRALHFARYEDRTNTMGGNNFVHYVGENEELRSNLADYIHKQPSYGIDATTYGSGTNYQSSDTAKYFIRGVNQVPKSVQYVIGSEDKKIDSEKSYPWTIHTHGPNEKKHVIVIGDHGTPSDEFKDGIFDKTKHIKYVRVNSDAGTVPHAIRVITRPGFDGVKYYNTATGQYFTVPGHVAAPASYMSPGYNNEPVNHGAVPVYIDNEHISHTNYDTGSGTDNGSDNIKSLEHYLDRTGISKTVINKILKNIPGSADALPGITRPGNEIGNYKGGDSLPEEKGPTTIIGNGPTGNNFTVPVLDNDSITILPVDTIVPRNSSGDKDSSSTIFNKVNKEENKEKPCKNETLDLTDKTLPFKNIDKINQNATVVVIDKASQDSDEVDEDTAEFLDKLLSSTDADTTGKSDVDDINQDENYETAKISDDKYEILEKERKTLKTHTENLTKNTNSEESQSNQDQDGENPKGDKYGGEKSKNPKRGANPKSAYNVTEVVESDKSQNDEDKDGENPNGKKYSGNHKDQLKGKKKHHIHKSNKDVTEDTTYTTWSSNSSDETDKIGIVFKKEKKSTEESDEEDEDDFRLISETSSPPNVESTDNLDCQDEEGNLNATDEICNDKESGTLKKRKISKKLRRVDYSKNPGETNSTDTTVIIKDIKTFEESDEGDKDGDTFIMKKSLMNGDSTDNKDGKNPKGDKYGRDNIENKFKKPKRGAHPDKFTQGTESSQSQYDKDGKNPKADKYGGDNGEKKSKNPKPGTDPKDRDNFTEVDESGEFQNEDGENPKVDDYIGNHKDKIKRGKNTRRSNNQVTEDKTYTTWSSKSSDETRNIGTVFRKENKSTEESDEEDKDYFRLISEALSLPDVESTGDLEGQDGEGNQNKTDETFNDNEFDANNDRIKNRKISKNPKKDEHFKNADETNSTDTTVTTNDTETSQESDEGDEDGDTLIIITSPMNGESTYDKDGEMNKNKSDSISDVKESDVNNGENNKDKTFEKLQKVTDSINSSATTPTDIDRRENNTLEKKDLAVDVGKAKTCNRYNKKQRQYNQDSAKRNTSETTTNSNDQVLEDEEYSKDDKKTENHQSLEVLKSTVSTKTKIMDSHTDNGCFNKSVECNTTDKEKKVTNKNLLNKDTSMEPKHGSRPSKYTSHEGFNRTTHGNTSKLKVNINIKKKKQKFNFETDNRSTNNITGHIKNLGDQQNSDTSSENCDYKYNNDTKDDLSDKYAHSKDTNLSSLSNENKETTTEKINEYTTVLSENETHKNHKHSPNKRHMRHSLHTQRFIHSTESNHFDKKKTEESTAKTDCEGNMEISQIEKKQKYEKEHATTSNDSETYKNRQSSQYDQQSSHHISHHHRSTHITPSLSKESKMKKSAKNTAPSDDEENADTFQFEKEQEKASTTSSNENYAEKNYKSSQHDKHHNHQSTHITAGSKESEKVKSEKTDGEGNTEISQIEKKQKHEKEHAKTSNYKNHKSSQHDKHHNHQSTHITKSNESEETDGDGNTEISQIEKKQKHEKEHATTSNDKNHKSSQHDKHHNHQSTHITKSIESEKTDGDGNMERSQIEKKQKHKKEHATTSNDKNHKSSQHDKHHNHQSTHITESNESENVKSEKTDGEENKERSHTPSSKEKEKYGDDFTQTDKQMQTVHNSKFRSNQDKTSKESGEKKRDIYGEGNMDPYFHEERKQTIANHSDDLRQKHRHEKTHHHH